MQADGRTRFLDNASPSYLLIKCPTDKLLKPQWDVLTVVLDAYGKDITIETSVRCQDQVEVFESSTLFKVSKLILCLLALGFALFVVGAAKSNIKRLKSKKLHPEARRGGRSIEEAVGRRGL